MVYLDVYDSIFEYLEEIKIVDDVFDYAEEILGFLLNNVHGHEMRNDLVAEFGLFNYMHNNQILLDFLSKKLYPNLNKKEKIEFNLIKESERFNLRFNKKEKLDMLDTKGKELYDFYFVDIDDNETKIVISSTPLDKLRSPINARLFHNPKHQGKYSIIGGIYDNRTSELLSSASAMGLVQKKLKEEESNAKLILKFSKEHNLAEIEQYKNEKSNFIEQDKKIMKINRLFFERFKIGLDDLSRDFLELSNNADTFIDMAEHYLSIAVKLRKTVLDTNYLFLLRILPAADLIKGFVAFVKKDKIALEQSLTELKEHGKKEFKNNINNEISLTRENIINNTQKFLNEKVAPLKPKGFDSFIKKLENYSAEQIKEFLSEVLEYLSNLPEPGLEILFFLSMTENLLEKAEKTPYLSEIKEKQKGYKYIPEEFYEYIDADDNIYELFIFLSVADFVAKQKRNNAYELIKKNKIAKTESFGMMFLAGKIFNFFNDKMYKPYFLKAKKIDRERYKKELKLFLEEKKQKKLSL